MGAARTVTAVARSEFERYRQRVERAMADGKITEDERVGCEEDAKQVSARLIVADHRMSLIRFATGDVQRVRSIEDHAARNNITPLAFDFGPEPEAA